MLQMRFTSNNNDAESLRDFIQDAVGKAKEVLIDPIMDLNPDFPGMTETFCIKIGESNEFDLGLVIDIDCDLQYEDLERDINVNN